MLMIYAVMDDCTMIDCCVIKIGSALLTKSGQELDKDIIARLADEISQLVRSGTSCVLVSSGAVAAGMAQLRVTSRPSAIPQLQALAAIGQMGLVQAYQKAFFHHGVQTAQVLLTHDDLVDRKRYLNARATLRELLLLGVVPVVNENDTVATEEMCLGDNDNLAAVVCNLVSASLVLILTDQGGLYTKDPRLQKDAELVSVASVNDTSLDEYVGGSLSGLGRGGMVTKLESARLAARVGAATFITTQQVRRGDLVLHAFSPEIVACDDQGMLKPNFSALENLEGTLLLPAQNPVKARKQWLAAHHRQLAGGLVVDSGAAAAVCTQGKSLLPVGIQSIAGQFDRGAMVGVYDESRRLLAHGLVNFSSNELEKIKGIHTKGIPEKLGFMSDDVAIHRDNMVLRE